MINELNDKSKAIGLEMNKLKTKVMFNQYCKSNQNIKLDVIALEAVSKTLYLGQIIVMSPDKKIEIQRRIALAWQAFGRANLIFSSPLPLSLKRSL